MKFSAKTVGNPKSCVGYICDGDMEYIISTVRKAGAVMEWQTCPTTAGTRSGFDFQPLQIIYVSGFSGSPVMEGNDKSPRVSYRIKEPLTLTLQNRR